VKPHHLDAALRRKMEKDADPAPPTIPRLIYCTMQKPIHFDVAQCGSGYTIHLNKMHIFAVTAKLRNFHQCKQIS
jgi:hypothetical protein